MPENSAHFDLGRFLPYLLNRAAEVSGVEFQRYYRDKYGMLRNEWRVLFHLWRYGDLTAKDICDRAALHKTKVSRAVSALEQKRFLVRERMEHDRRNELLRLSRAGRAACGDLTRAAAEFDARLLSGFTPHEQTILRGCLERIIAG
jgi:DNA-binding MarR family transcriptional regulator